MGGLARPKDGESYAGGSIATGRVTHAGQVSTEGPDQERPQRKGAWISGTNEKLIRCREGRSQYRSDLGVEVQAPADLQPATAQKTLTRRNPRPEGREILLGLWGKGDC